MRRLCKGFTLLELVMVLIIFAVLVGSAVFISTQSIQANRLIGAANKLTSDIRYAQALAISRQVPCGVYFDTQAKNYFVYINNTSNLAPDPYTGTTLIVNYNTDEELKGIGLVSTTFGNTLSFDYMGTPSAGGSIVLGAGSQTKTVIIRNNTGGVSFQ